MSEAFINSDAAITAAEHPQNTAWFAVQTMYRHEQRISRDLVSKGFSTYLPLLREMRQWSDRRKMIEIPAFSGYVFVRQDSSLRSRVRVLETPGVVRVLGANRMPAPIPDAEIESLRRMIDKGNSCERCECPSIGAVVEVQRGPLAGVRGRLVEIRNSFRLVLSVSAVSQAISVEVDLNDLAPFPFELIEQEREAPRACA